MTNPVGRPRKYKDAQTMQSRIELYFEDCERRERPATIAGLAYALGFLSTETLTEYEGYEKEFSETIKRARLRIEQEKSERLLDKRLFTPGVQFDLKVNHGWKETVHVDQTSSDGSMSPKAVPDDLRAALDAIAAKLASGV